MGRLKRDQPAGRWPGASSKAHTFLKPGTSPGFLYDFGPWAYRRRSLNTGYIALSVVLALLSLVGITWDFLWKGLPHPLALQNWQPPQSIRVYDRNKQLLYTFFDNENRTIIPLSSVSPWLIEATVAVEDERFYKHHGLDPVALARAVWHNLRSDSIQGGSTLTQQLVKNILLSPERTIQRKVREAILAILVDALYSKEDILTYYLNAVNYGGTIYGVEQAAWWYFGKSASELTLSESSFLAGLPAAPSVLKKSLGEAQTASTSAALARQHFVLDHMLEQGKITQDQARSAKEEVLAFRSPVYPIVAPHFVHEVMAEVRTRLGAEVVERGGLEIMTTLDVAVQATAEAAVQRELARLGRYRVQNGAALVTEPRSGAVLAMVGSRDYFDQEIDGKVNIVTRLRQPGSSIKPVTYAAAFERGYKPDDKIDDSPVQFASKGSAPYVPKNYDGKFRGPVTLREALGSSYNIPAVRLLATIGVPTLIQTGRDMGISTWNDPARFGLALTLGAGEVKMIDMAQVYGTFANDGLTVPVRMIDAIATTDGKTLWKDPCAQASEPCQARRVLAKQTTDMVTSILTDNDARTPAFGSHSVLNLPGKSVAVKTGTTNSLRDNWTAGYTNERVVITWVGNNDNTPMSAVASGITGASPIWRSIVEQVVPGRGNIVQVSKAQEKNPT